MYALATNIDPRPVLPHRRAAPAGLLPGVLAMSDDRPRMADIWIRATRLVGVISIPALVGLAIVAPDFVAGRPRAEVGRRDRPSSRSSRSVGLIQSLQTLCGEVLLALGRANWLLRFTMLWFVASLAVVRHRRPVGRRSASRPATRSRRVLVEPVRTYITARALGISPWRFVAALSGVAQAAVLMASVPARRARRRSSQPACRRPRGSRSSSSAGGGVYVACLPLAGARDRVRDQGRRRSAGGRRRRPCPAPIDAPLERV